MHSLLHPAYVQTIQAEQIARASANRRTERPSRRRGTWLRRRRRDVLRPAPARRWAVSR